MVYNEDNIILYNSLFSLTFFPDKSLAKKVPSHKEQGLSPAFENTFVLIRPTSNDQCRLSAESASMTASHSLDGLVEHKSERELRMSASLPESYSSVGLFFLLIC